MMKSIDELTRMTAQYTKYWKRLIDKKMKPKDFIISAGISANILAKLSKDEFVSIWKV